MKVLFIQHAGALGGSAYSLLYTIQGLREQGYFIEVALLHAAEDLQRLYTDAGFSVHLEPRIGVFSHTTGGYARLRSPVSCLQFARQILRWKSAQRATLELVKRTAPQIVHLNSVVLMPSAQALRRARVPHVWHVRECPPFQDWRTRLIRRELVRHAEVIYLSEHDRGEWSDAETHGTVVPNFVDFAQFDSSLDQGTARRQLGLETGNPLVLYVGGTPAIKGFSVLLEAIPAVKSRFPDVVFAMPGAAIVPSSSWPARAARALLPIVGWGTAGQRVRKRIARLEIEGSVKMLPFARDIVAWMAACDLLVFPSTVPHFARPVIEAGAMGRPVVGSDIGGVRELILEGETGLLIPPGDSAKLAEAINSILGDPHRAGNLGAAGRQRAHDLYCMENNTKRVCACYRRIVKEN